MTPINIGSRREVFWDDVLLEHSRTTAELKVHQPRIEEIVLECGEPWEGDGCNSFSIFKDGDIYRAYYTGWEMMNEDCTAHLVDERISYCYAESKDGIHWTKPNLNICEFKGSKENNIYIDDTICDFGDMVHVFIDENPACPTEEKYKAIGRSKKWELVCCTSADGIHFKYGWVMTNIGKFDTHNIAFWSPEFNCYFAYIRDFHGYKGNKHWQGVRDIRVMTSTDFKNWTMPEEIDFGGGADYPLYTNEVQRYPRAPHMFIGFPLRYAERKEWSDNIEQLPNTERRKKICGVSPRYGLAVTDTVFMSSRDGKKFYRYDEAFIDPGVECRLNWYYGDCSVAALVETKSSLKNAPDEYSLYCYENHWSGEPTELRRYTIRKDGFASISAPYGERKVFTRPFIFEGNRMELNFRTSARGYVHIKLHSLDGTIASCELFGNALDRKVAFDGDLSSFSGEEVTMEITMSDADIYSFRFYKE